MKTRAISAVVMLAIFVPLLVLGGTWFDIAVFVLAFLALKEFIDMKETKKQLPFFAKVISYLFMALLIATNIMSKNNNLEIDFRILSAFFMTFLIPTILYWHFFQFRCCCFTQSTGGVLRAAKSFCCCFLCFLYAVMVFITVRLLLEAL